MTMMHFFSNVEETSCFSDGYIPVIQCSVFIFFFWGGDYLPLLILLWLSLEKHKSHKSILFLKQGGGGGFNTHKLCTFSVQLREARLLEVEWGIKTWQGYIWNSTAIDYRERSLLTLNTMGYKKSETNFLLHNSLQGPYNQSLFVYWSVTVCYTIVYH